VTRPRRALLVTAGAAAPLVAAVIWLAGGLAAGAPPAEEPAAGPVREIAVGVHAWGFSPGVVRVRPGQKVRFVVRSDDITHGFAINELGLNLPLRPGREARSPELDVALPEGTYTIHCSTFCGLGHASMKAKLIVGAPGPAPVSAAPWIASALAMAVVCGLTGLAGRRGGRRR
jgi:cytochrome c oxidase subunit 2